MRVLACLILVLGMLTACSDATESAPHDTSTTDSLGCPEDLSAAEGTPCSDGGQICSNGCSGCSPCWLLECPYGAGSVWTALEAHPPQNCVETPDAGRTDVSSTDADEGPMDTMATGE